ncbi:hypothetical protein CEXT_644231 [Caerostris extrusa]|uniref:Uncharacterized protein n=1 Tax=Caerostris extrusa TaxID=172846 RepID=A0AAV4RQP1_CAEEX|nr:hypothetical protein CEXT_644231 [Caerostris extrusa]
MDRTRLIPIHETSLDRGSIVQDSWQFSRTQCTSRSRLMTVLRTEHLSITTRQHSRPGRRGLGFIPVPNAPFWEYASSDTDEFISIVLLSYFTL